MIAHVETIIDATLATLRANLPGAIATINAATTDFDLETPASKPGLTDDGYVAGGFQTIRLPMIEVAAVDGTLTDWSVQQSDAEHRFGMIVRAQFEDLRSEPGRLYRRALRYGTALLRVLTVPDAFTPVGTGRVAISESGVRWAYRWNPEIDEREEVVGQAILIFALENVETRVP